MRRVVRDLYADNLQLAGQQLTRRHLATDTTRSTRNFRRARRNNLGLIRVNELMPLRATVFDEADEAYRLRPGEASIDLIMNAVVRHSRFV